MSESEATSAQADLAALKALQADAPELERIESLLDRFNVFEAINFINDEERHSRFLAFLLDPSRNDGLGDLPIKGLLRETLSEAQKSLPPSAFGGLDRVLENLDYMDLGKTLVRTEHYFVDVLLTNEDHKLAVIVENKIEAGEGPSQLDWYDRIIRHTHPDWDVHHIYLTPSGATPSHRAYTAFTYGRLCDIVDGVLEARGPTVDPNVRVPIEHYVSMVRRRILGDPDIVSLSQNLYEKHKRAFDLVYRHRPNVRAQIKEMVVGLITQEPRLALDKTELGNIKFGVREWDTSALLIPEDFPQQWTSSRRMLLFQITNDQNILSLHLFMGPGPEETRQKLLNMVRSNEPEVFILPRATSSNWIPIYHRPILKPEVYDKLTRQQREEEIRRHWNEFFHKDLPCIEAALGRER